MAMVIEDPDPFSMMTKGGDYDALSRLFDDLTCTPTHTSKSIRLLDPWEVLWPPRKYYILHPVDSLRCGGVSDAQRRFFACEDFLVYTVFSTHVASSRTGVESASVQTGSLALIISTRVVDDLAKLNPSGCCIPLRCAETLS